MLTQGEDVEAQALRKRGWTITAIANHLGRDRKTVRAYLRGERQAGVRRRHAPDPLETFIPYLTQRFADDPHVWASALYDEVKRLGYPLSYPSFVRQVRNAKLRPHCEACNGVRGRDTTEIAHPPAEEIQWDWFERRGAPWGGTAYVLLGTLAHSGRIRGEIAESMDQAHLIEAMDRILRKLGGTTRDWRVDRMATVVVPGTGEIQPTFAPVAKHYGASVKPCPPRRGNRKGVVESSVRFVSGRWWRTLVAEDPASAQVSLDHFLATVGDARTRRVGGVSTTVGELADAEALSWLPAPYPALVEAERQVAANATVNYRGNRYSVPPGLSGSVVTLSHRLGGVELEIRSAAQVVLATHRMAHPGANAVLRDPSHAAALEKVVLGAFTVRRPCNTKAHTGISDAALAEAAKLSGGAEVKVDLEAYARLVER